MDTVKKIRRNLIFRMKIGALKIGSAGAVTLTGNGGKSQIAHSCNFSCDKNSKITLGKITAAQNSHMGAVGGGRLTLGDNVFLNRNCILASRDSLTVGDNCRFGPNVCVYDHDHTFGKAKERGEDFKTSPIVIGNNCWIGANAVILRGSRIGDNCVIGAGCIITGEIPANSIVKADRDYEIVPIK